MLKLKLKAY